MLENFIDFFFPHFCPVCGEVDQLLCDKCERELGTATQICPVCNEESLMGWTHKQCKKKGCLDGLISLFEYGDPSVRKVVDNIKYDFNKELLFRLFKKIKIEVGIDFDFIVPVPLHYHRQNWRGFNQAEVIATVLSSLVRLPGGQVSNGRFENLLIRKVNTVQQVKMPDKMQRKQNVKGIFVIDKTFEQMNLNSKKVLLVDDVFTTGASMNECCKILKKNGVKTVWGFSLCH